MAAFSLCIVGLLRRLQRVTVQLFVHCERLQLQTKDKEGDITIEYYYNDGDMEDRAWNQKTVRFVRVLEENCTLVEMMKNWKDKKLEDDNTGGQDVKGVSVM